MKRDSLKLYNVLFPIWLLVFFPSPLWLLLIPANYAWDYVVLSKSLSTASDRKTFCRKNTWKICLAGFLGDLVGAAFLFLCIALPDVGEQGSSLRDLVIEIQNSLGMNPFSSVGGFLLVLLGVLIASAVIYVVDQYLLQRAGLDAVQAKKSAKALAVFTAPILFFVPSIWLYR